MTTTTERTSTPLGLLYSLEAIMSVGYSLLLVGIFFYTEHRWGWGLFQNFSLAAAQGAAYLCGALSANALAARLGHRRLLLALHVLLAVLSAAAGLAPYRNMSVAMLLVYTFVGAAVWPTMESAICRGADAVQMSHRVGVYNVVWAGVGAAAIALSGTIIQFLPEGYFFLTTASHILAAALVQRLWREDRGAAVPVSAPALAPEPALARQRTLALWLSRIAMPATFVVIYSLMAMMPLLPVLRDRSPAAKTVLATVWLAARLAAFVVLGLTVWWHTRPRLLLLSAALLLVAFLGIVLRPSDLLDGLSPSLDLPSMLAWQIVLGVTMGMIYSGSLYFGMVLSDGSTEHGGYHEALIGLGSILGPGAAALAQWHRPGELLPGIFAVAGLMTLSLLVAGVTAARLARPRQASSR